jgi:predicted AAA+ superfamily ATPase
MELLLKHNPWWKGEEDHHLSRWKGMKIRWVPSWIEEISLKPFSLNFVIGPRQVGKTTGLKILISKLLESRDPKEVVYFNCDFAPDFHALKKVLDRFLELRKSWGVSSSLVFLDEVTSTRGWWRLIKGYIDLGIFENDILTVTGSSSLRLRGEVELFPGRRGEGKEIVVYPLSFREFLRVQGIGVKVTGDLKRDMANASIKEEEILRAFQTYLRTGGFPASINEVPTATEDFLGAIEGEILRLGRSVSLVREILASIFQKAPSPLSYSTIASDTSGYSYKTVAEYLEVLKGLMILDIASFRENGRVLQRKEKKIFFLDPFIARTLSVWSGQEFLESALYEWVVQSHLLRKFGEVYYYRNSYEVDCIAGELKVEVKKGKPHRRYPKQVLVLEENLPMFLAVL